MIIPLVGIIGIGFDPIGSENNENGMAWFSPNFCLSIYNGVFGDIISFRFLVLTFLAIFAVIYFVLIAIWAKWREKKINKLQKK